jgi:cobalt/nickel transport system permease protein
VPAAAFAFALLFEVGGTVDVPFSTVATAMVGVHTVIGLGEALITALAVLSIVAVRPDLVHGARPSLQRRTLTIRQGVAA